MDALTDAPPRTRAALVAAARGMIGTPFRHRGRQPGKELDCVGLLIFAARKAGFDAQDGPEYTERPTGRELIATLRAQMVEVSDPKPGSTLVFRVGRRPTHVGIATGEGSMVHALNRNARTRRGTLSKVVEENLTPAWMARIAYVFDFPGVADG